MMNKKGPLALIVAAIILVITLIPFFRESLILNPWRQLTGATFLSSTSLPPINNDAKFAQGGPIEPSPVVVPGDLCQGYGDDRDYVYNLDTNIFLKANGKESFDLKRHSDSKVVRQSSPNDSFFEDRSNGALNISYDIAQACGGVDVTYTVTNPTFTQQQLPNFKIEGIKQAKTNAKYLYTKEWGTLIDIPSTNGVYYQLPYPTDVIYSPVTVSVNNDISIGSSFNYPYLNYKHTITPFMWWNGDGSITTQYTMDQTAYLAAGATRTYTINLRFAPQRNWILTLYPYKQYFNSLYGSVKQIHTKDLRPVLGNVLAYMENQDDNTNPRGYIQRPYNGTNQRFDIAGWGADVEWVLDYMSAHGYRRLMTWLPTGVYSTSGSCSNCNFPAQFVSHWTGNLAATAGELQKINGAGIPLGLWWGHAGAVPVPNTWPPSRLDKADLSNPAHRQFLEAELIAARNLGMKVVGLDAIPEMSVIDRWNWIDRIRQLAPGVQIVHEIGGPDLLHAKVDNFYTDTFNRSTLTWNYIGGPHVLSWYLNPQSEVWVGVSGLAPEVGGTAGLTERAQQLTTWGYTYVDWDGAEGSQINPSDLSQCLDHKDNDGDGKIDWPYDSGCASERDETEIRDVTSFGSQFPDIPEPPPTPPPGGGGSSGGGGSGTNPTQEELLRQIEELMAIVRMLQAQLAAQTSSHIFNTNLGVGKSGSEVTFMQKYLVAKGYLTIPSGVSYGYFGTLTKNALIKFQKANRISPASGFFGPLTRAFVNKK